MKMCLHSDNMLNPQDLNRRDPRKKFSNLHHKLKFSPLLYYFISAWICSSATPDKQVYIAYMGALPSKEHYSASDHHRSILEQVLENSSHSESLVRSYKRSFNGFAAKLTQRESLKLAGMSNIISVFPCRPHALHTTRSWNFMGFKENIKRVPEVESNIIIGVIDSGIWHGAESFNDKGFSSPPKKWNGACYGGKFVKCNNKLIGARSYSLLASEADALDRDGHGTHTASTAAGNQVNGVSFFGLGQGNARGAVPSARIAAYKACWEGHCHSSDILAAFDDAISDGVDIISLSIGLNRATNYTEDPIAIGSFHAMQKGILASQSAGNNGPTPKSVVSNAPWLLTVAASNTDRSFMSKVVLGDNDKTELMGKGIYPYDMEKKAPLTKTHEDMDSIQGKIVIYKDFNNGTQALNEKAAGMIVQGVSHDSSFNYPLPTSYLDTTELERLETYLHHARNPTATIIKSEILRDDNAPTVASFSSRGPNPISSDILKPDITAPGIDILAAWSLEASPSGLEGDMMRITYNIKTGTSMACPHVSGIAAYLKTFHPDWSPSAIKSAIITTASRMSATNDQDAEYSYGAGHINPLHAVNPGLIYDCTEKDFVNYLCSLGTNAEKMVLMTGNITYCSMKLKEKSKDLNYPSIVSMGAGSFFRTVTNVGNATCTYRAVVVSPSNLNITVIPEVVNFKYLNEKQAFIVRIAGTAVKGKRIHSASLVWSDGFHRVRSPIVVHLESKGVRVTTTMSCISIVVIFTLFF